MCGLKRYKALLRRKSIAVQLGCMQAYEVRWRIYADTPAVCGGPNSGKIWQKCSFAFFLIVPIRRNASSVCKETGKAHRKIINDATVEKHDSISKWMYQEFMWWIKVFKFMCSNIDFLLSKLQLFYYWKSWFMLFFIFIYKQVHEEIQNLQFIQIITPWLININYLLKSTS